MENPGIIKKEKVDMTSQSVTSTTHSPVSKLQVRVKQEIITLSSDESDVDDGQAFIVSSRLEPIQTIVKQEKVVEKEVEIPVGETNKLNESFKVQLVKKHPDLIVENASLATISLPDVRYKLVLPEEIIDSGALSAVQLEPIIHACQRHKQRLPDGSRAGFLIGDGAGVGKGRVAAGIIVENYTLGRKKSIWIADSNDLQYDVERDLRDIGAEKIPVCSLSEFDSRISDFNQGVLFSTYSALVEEVRSSSGKYQARLKQLLKWCGVYFDGVIILDECHQAKNLFYSDFKSESAIELALWDLHNELPNARIVYICASGIAEPRNLGHMNRLGLWGRGTSFKASRSFIDTFETAGSMEIVGMELKQRGMYISRQLSFKDITFKAVEAFLTLKFINVYDNSVKMWDRLRESLTKATELVNSSPHVRRRLWSQYWSSHLKYFKYLGVSAKVMHAVKIAKKALKKGKCVVIGVQSTGDGYTLEKMEREGELSDFVSTTKQILQSLVEKLFSVSDYCDGIVSGKRKSSYESNEKIKRKKTESAEDDASDIEKEESGEDVENNRDNLTSIRNQLLAQIKKFGTVLPANWINHLIHELGGPQNVAEISNRKGRVLQKNNGKISYESRSETDVPLEMINIRERERFMDGEKNIAIVSSAAINGISLHADRRVKNQRPRVFILLDFPSSADLAIQQFGCVHRSNQSSAPEFIILLSELATERRFASIVGKHLESFGATNCGDGRVIEPIDPSEFNVDNKHGCLALESTMRSILGYKDPVVPPPADYQGDFCIDMSKALLSVGLIKKSALEINWKVNAHPPPYNTSIPKFISRILGISVELQTRLYKYFTDTLSITIHHAKMRSDFSAMGIVDLGIGQNIRQIKLQTFTNDTVTSKIELHRLEIDRGMNWETALKKWNSLTGDKEGFYVSNKFLNGKCGVSLVEKNDVPVRAGKNESLYTVFRPNTGRDIILTESAVTNQKFRKVTPFEAQPHWDDLYSTSESDCYHSYCYGRCSKKTIGLECHSGLRIRTYDVLCGPVLSIWNKVESILLNAKEIMQVVRVHVGSKRIVGLVIPTNCETSIANFLTKHF